MNARSRPIETQTNPVDRAPREHSLEREELVPLVVATEPFEPIEEQKSELLMTDQKVTVIESGCGPSDPPSDQLH